MSGNGALASGDARRDVSNRIEMMTFDSGASRLRWVYGNYMVPEHATNPDESSALTETVAAYQVGDHRTPDPLPGGLPFSEESVLPAGYWLRGL